MMKYVLGILILTMTVIWLGIFVSPDNNLHIIACDVGQGDAILLTYKNYQVLIDGGPNNKVLGCLSKYIPFWDRTIEGIILTHPEADHFTGLVDVFKNYKIEYLLANQVDNSTSGYSLLKKVVGGSKTQVINPYGGFKMRYGLIYLDIVNPSQELLSKENSVQSLSNGGKLGIYETKSNLNEFSIIGLWKFGNFQFLTTGDIPTDIFSEVVSTSAIPEIDYLKVPHHGSKTALSQQLLRILNPKIAIISVGKNNIYHLPNNEVLDWLKEVNTRILRTDLEGDIEVITNGEKWWLK